MMSRSAPLRGSSGQLHCRQTGADDSGCSDPAVFRGPKGESLWPHGWVMRLSDGGASRGASFRWRMVAAGGLPWQGGARF